MTMPKTTNGLIRVLLVAAFMLLLVTVAWAQYDPRGGTALIDKEGKSVEGEVQAFKRFDGQLLMVLVEWPITIRLTEQTVFESEDGRTVSLYSASSLLPGKAVRVYPRRDADGSYVADKIVVLSYEDLTRIRRVRELRMKPAELKRKDAVPQVYRR